MAIQMARFCKAGAPLREKIGEERALSMAHEHEGASLRSTRWTMEWKREQETTDSTTIVHNLERKLLSTRLPAGMDLTVEFSYCHLW
eukprot:SAG31_NODE_7151_length_1773_cov_1.458184_2_plen_87_part_00